MDPEGILESYKVFLYSLLLCTSLYKHDIPCPMPIYHKENIILMSFIGREEEPAPRLVVCLFEKELYDEIASGTQWIQSCFNHWAVYYDIEEYVL